MIVSSYFNRQLYHSSNNICDSPLQGDFCNYAIMKVFVYMSWSVLNKLITFYLLFLVEWLMYVLSTSTIINFTFAQFPNVNLAKNIR